MVTVVKCPACAAPVPWTGSSRWRPFCSERCKTIDLGAWAADRHVIPGDPLDPPMDATAAPSQVTAGTSGASGHRPSSDLLRRAPRRA